MTDKKSGHLSIEFTEGNIMRVTLLGECWMGTVDSDINEARQVVTSALQERVDSDGLPQACIVDFNNLPIVNSSTVGFLSSIRTALKTDDADNPNMQLTGCTEVIREMIETMKLDQLFTVAEEEATTPMGKPADKREDSGGSSEESPF